MDDNLISVVVPVYNNERYLSACLDSILSQTYKNFEIIVINDGSMDSSEAVALSYCEKDNRIKYFYKENGGVSSARNMGIEKARGEYICFVDSDDTVTVDYLQLLYENIQYSDLAIGNVCNNGQPFYKVNNFYPGIYEVEQFKSDVRNALNSILINVPWNKLYKTTLIRMNKLNFSPEFSMGEDLLFNLQYMDCCEKIAVFDKGIYNYRISENSVSGKYNPRHYQQKQKLYKIQKDFFNLDESSPEKQLVKVRMLIAIIYNELIANPALAVTSATIKKLAVENNLPQEISKLKASFFQLWTENKDILAFKYNLYWLCAMTWKSRKQ